MSEVFLEGTSDITSNRAMLPINSVRMSAITIDMHVDEADQRSGRIATTAFNPLARPGELVVVLARGDAGIGGKVANKLAVEHFTAAILEFDASQSSAHSSSNDKIERPRAVALLEAGFERANGQIYSFGHKLAAGGKLATSIVAIAISDGELAAAKVGDGDIVLQRDGETVYLFAAQTAGGIDDSALASMDGESTESLSKGFTGTGSTILVGAHREVPVEFLQLTVEPHDEVMIVEGASSSEALQVNESVASWRIHLGPASVFLDTVIG